jgi:hypothetical protein
MYRNNSDIPNDQRVTVRRTHVGDGPALARLAALDSGPPPEGPMLVAESDTRLLAALPLGSGRPIADPFEPTAGVVALLRYRADQLSAGRERPRIAKRIRRRLLGRTATT